MLSLFFKVASFNRHLKLLSNLPPNINFKSNHIAEGMTKFILREWKRIEVYNFIKVEFTLKFQLFL